MTASKRRQSLGRFIGEGGGVLNSRWV